MNRILAYFGILTILATGFSSCNEKTILGAGLTPAIDNINTFFTDTLTIITKNIPYDSLVTSSATSNNLFYPLGSINSSASGDNAFGRTTASFALQFRQPQTSILFPKDSFEVDSVVLCLPIFRSYGDTLDLSTTTFNCYRLNTPLKRDTNYIVSQPIDYKLSDFMGSGSLSGNKLTSPNVLVGYKGPQLRIKLPKIFADSLGKLKDTVEYKDYPTFVKWLKGFAIVPNDSLGGTHLLYIDYSNAQLQMFSRTTKVAKKDTIAYLFPFDYNYCASHANIYRNYTDNNPLINNFFNTNNPLGDSILFVQGDCGSSIELSLPTLGSFPLVMVNKAEFEFTVIGSGNNAKDSLYRPVALFRSTGIDTNKKDYLLEDDYLKFGDGTIRKLIDDGYRKVVVENGITKTKYRINLTRTVQKAISKKDSKLKIRFIGINGLLGSGRVIVGGANRVVDKAKMNLIYTKIK